MTELLVLLLGSALGIAVSVVFVLASYQTGRVERFWAEVNSCDGDETSLHIPESGFVYVVRGPQMYRVDLRRLLPAPDTQLESTMRPDFSGLRKDG
jgi:hypothetical protein